MSFNHSPEQVAIASQLATELAEYQAGLAQLLAGHWDADLYREVSERFDRMQMYAQALPQVGMSWSELLISRVDLTRALWDTRTPARVDGLVAAMYAQHQVLIREVVRRCMRYVTRLPTPTGGGAQASHDR